VNAIPEENPETIETASKPPLEGFRIGGATLEQEIASLRTYLLKVAHSLAGGRSTRAGVAPSDLVHEAIKSALVDIRRGGCRAQSAGQLRAWVRQILHGKYYDSLRKTRRARPVELPPDLLDPGTSPSGRFEERERDDLAARALAGLGLRDRQLLAWRQDENLTFEEIGRRLGISLQGARQAFRRAAERYLAATQDPSGADGEVGRGGAA
jgi:RNA polymerase sigma-70 factor (ECF subfamily)